MTATTNVNAAAVVRQIRHRACGGAGRVTVGRSALPTLSLGRWGGVFVALSGRMSEPTSGRMSSLAAHWTIRLERVSGRSIEWLPGFEVSIDCVGCRRLRRTVSMVNGEPGGECHPGRRSTMGRHAVESSVRHWNPSTGDHEFKLDLEVQYPYVPFNDAVDERRSDPTSHAWIRVYFVVACEECGNETRTSTQSNLVRPHPVRCSTCGVALVRDTAAPMVTVREAGAAPG